MSPAEIIQNRKRPRGLSTGPTTKGIFTPLFNSNVGGSYVFLLLLLPLPLPLVSLEAWAFVLPKAFVVFVPLALAVFFSKASGVFVALTLRPLPLVVVFGASPVFVVLDVFVAIALVALTASVAWAVLPCRTFAFVAVLWVKALCVKAFLARPVFR